MNHCPERGRRTFDTANSPHAGATPFLSASHDDMRAAIIVIGAEYTQGAIDDIRTNHSIASQSSALPSGTTEQGN
jgi:hypothetical protein